MSKASQACLAMPTRKSLNNNNNNNNNFGKDGRTSSSKDQSGK